MAESISKKKRTWDPQKMKFALDAINKGSKIKTAARNFDVPESTLRDRLKLGEDDDPPLGRKATFTQEEEKEMCEHISIMAKKFYGITQQQLRKLAYEFATAKNIKNIFSSEKGMAGKCWVYSFLKRNPGISLRLPEPTSLNRVLGFNKSEISIFFVNLEELITKYSFSASRIFNVDETGITTVQKPAKIYAPTGLKQVGKATSAERGQNVTVVCAFSATGIYVPPMFIYPRQRIKASLSVGGPPGAIYKCSKSGWINEDLFVKWLQHFAKHIGAHAQNPALLVLNNHSSHQSLNAFQFCRENGIHILSLPPHTSHKMQPLDVTFYGPLKSAYSRECDLYMKMHPYERITQDFLAYIFNKAYTRVATMEKAVKGFEVTGIYPLNPHIFDEDDILTSDPIVEEATSSRSIQANQREEIASTVDSPSIEHPTRASRINQDDSTRSISPSSSILNESSVNSSSTLVTADSINDQPKRRTSRRILEELNPVPQKIIKMKRKVKKQHSLILTASPLKGQLEEKEKRRKLKESNELTKGSKGKNVKGKNLAKGKSVKRKTSSTIEISDDDETLANKDETPTK